MSRIMTAEEFKDIGSQRIAYLSEVYLFQRICKLKECETRIFTNRENHYFCCTEHHDIYWKRERSKDKIFEDRFLRIESDIKEIKDILGLE